MNKLSLIMPVYNEGETLETVLKRVGEMELSIPFELIIVDDGSSDGAVDRIDRGWVSNASEVIVIEAKRNQGKGAALRRGFAAATGDILGVQDADLEYDPVQVPGLVQPILDDRAEVVFGTREFGAHASFSFWYVVGNKGLSMFASAVFDRYVTDIYTCYKFMTRERYEQLHLTANGFEIEAELAGGLLRNGARVFEIPVTYSARSRAEGKKIKPSDGFKGLARLVRVRVRGW